MLSLALYGAAWGGLWLATGEHLEVVPSIILSVGIRFVVGWNLGEWRLDSKR